MKAYGGFGTELKRIAADAAAELRRERWERRPAKRTVGRSQPPTKAQQRYQVRLKRAARMQCELNALKIADTAQRIRRARVADALKELAELRDAP